MKAFILAAGFGKRLEPLTFELPKPMLPVLNKPFLEYILLHLVNYNFKEVKINLHHLPEFIDSYFCDGKDFGLNIYYSLEKKILGTAGALIRNLSYFKDTILVQYGCCLADINLNELIEFHKKNNSQLTVVVKDSKSFNRSSQLYFKNLELTEKQSISVNFIEDSFQPIGIFVFEPEVLQSIKNFTYLDILPDVVNIALESKFKVCTYPCEGKVFLIETVEDFFNVNQELLIGLSVSSDKLFYYGKNTKFSNSIIKNLKSPVFVGDNVILEEGIEFKGPVIIGNDVKISKNVILDNSIVLNNTFIGENLEISNSIVFKELIFNIKTKYGVYISDDVILRSFKKLPFKEKFNKILLRVTDILLSGIALILFSPLFLVIALLIKFDSRGPVFFKSKRVKRPEELIISPNLYKYQKQEDVIYYKFRTMFEGSEDDESLLNEENIYGKGPYFKAKEDKRVTRVGKYLRKFSIDELPLLINVFKGDLSLVGIWGLPEREAKLIKDKGIPDEIIDLKETASLRFKGKLGLAGYWQSAGRSNLSAEERAIHDSIQALSNIEDDILSKNLGEYKKTTSFKGYYSLILRTINSVINKKGAF